MSYHDDEVCESNAEDLERLIAKVTETVERNECNADRVEGYMRANGNPRTHAFQRYEAQRNIYRQVARDLRCVLYGY